MSERLYVVSFPELAAVDARLLGELRARYHPSQADRIGPHFTFAFALPSDAEATLTAQLRAVAGATAPIAFTLSRVVPIADPASGRAYIALVPHRGHVAMIDLHRQLHEGPLERYREPAIRFQPHLTVGVFDTADESVAKIAERIAADMRDGGAVAGITGRLAELAIVAEAAEAIRERFRIKLGGVVARP
jgi:2'-5' RNA ligase